MPDIDRKCLFHADRPQFDKLERELTDSNLLPRCNSHRLASAICSCNKEKGIFGSVSNDGRCMYRGGGGGGLFVVDDYRRRPPPSR